MATSLSSYASKYIAEKGMEVPTRKSMKEVFDEVVLPPKEHMYGEISLLIEEEQRKISKERGK